MATLKDIRDALRPLSRWTIGGKNCWCQIPPIHKDGDKHERHCLAARKVYYPKA